MKNNLKEISRRILIIAGQIDDARETLDSVIQEATMSAELKKDVKESAADLRNAYDELSKIRDEIRLLISN